MKTFIAKQLILGGLLAVSASAAFADQPPNTTNLGLNAQLDGKQQVPVVLTNGKGTFFANTTSTTITYQLSTSNLSSNVMEAHIHLAQPLANGGVMIILCAPNTPGVSSCPQDPKGNINLSGTISYMDVNAFPGIPGQGLPSPVNFLKVLKAFRDGNAYVNIHTAKIDGEIRGQVQTGGGIPTHS